MTDYDEIRALLHWYDLCGVDEVTNSALRDRYGETSGVLRPTGPTTPGVTGDSRSSAISEQREGGNEVALDSKIIPNDKPGPAQEIAFACQSLDELAAAMQEFEGCALKRTAGNTVIGDGNSLSKLMFVGEAPGAEEDRAGLPFVGPAGRLLDKMIGAIGFDRSSVYITNLLPWRPPGNRSPTSEELAICQPFLERQIELIHPQVLVLVGGIAAKALLGRREGITRLRGHWYSYSTPRLSRPIPAIATFHPAYLLRKPHAKREVWRDMLEIENKFRDVEALHK